MASLVRATLGATSAQYGQFVHGRALVGEIRIENIDVITGSFWYPMPYVGGSDAIQARGTSRACSLCACPQERAGQLVARGIRSLSRGSKIRERNIDRIVAPALIPQLQDVVELVSIAAAESSAEFLPSRPAV